jgi:hypothetical protein
MCRHKALECERRATLATEPNIRETFVDLARQWRDMADQAQDRKFEMAKKADYNVTWIGQLPFRALAALGEGQKPERPRRSRETALPVSASPPNVFA